MKRCSMKTVQTSRQSQVLEQHDKMAQRQTKSAQQKHTYQDARKKK